MKPLLIFLLFICFAFHSLSQSGTIQGYILDNQNRLPLSGVSINITGHTHADNSDNFGMFRITGLEAGIYEIVVSHIGYDTKKLTTIVQDNNTAMVSTELDRSSLTLADVTVSTKRNATFNTIALLDIKLRPVNTSQDILRAVSGLFIAQHAGGGKAEQIFLRGYDIDHGTDINITVDGMPVNMVSHAHGQGYADLHFLIPETVEKVNFDKGPYFAGKGNLATAGFVEIQTKDFLEKNCIQLQAGRFNTQRTLGLFKILSKENERKKQQFYIASEYFRSNGYFDSPQKFHRFNIMGKYSAVFTNNARLTIIASTLDSRWDASGQIPERAVADSSISKFGSIDNSEGGNTNRTNITAKFTKQWKGGWQTSDQFYFTNYRFNLYSNFTFFLIDSTNGDEINQRERRDIYGYTGTVSKNFSPGTINANTEFGWGLRYDEVANIELNHVVKRKFLNSLQQGSIQELNGFLYSNSNIELSNKFTIIAGLRYDFFRFGYKSFSSNTAVFKNQQRGTVSPKLNFNYIINPKLKVYLNTGIGFHSNDTRVILNDKAEKILPRVFGTDIGVVLKPLKSLFIKTAIWYLYSQQEFIYVGDEGIVEPSGKTRRVGLDMSMRYQATRWLYADMDINYANARAVDAGKSENFVPLAPTFTSIGGLTVKTKKGFNCSLRYRYIDSRPANETNTIRADGYFLLDAIASYTHGKIELSLSMENILNSYWKEAQFDTESRLQFETKSVSEIHYTPGTPRFFKAGIGFVF